MGDVGKFRVGSLGEQLKEQKGFPREKGPGNTMQKTGVREGPKDQGSSGNC